MNSRSIPMCWVKILLSFSILTSLHQAGHTATWYVHDGTPNGDGTSWEESFRVLQDAIDSATSGDEIRVAGNSGGAGLIYSPTRQIPISAGPSDNDPEDHYAFLLKDGVAILGGFAGVGSATPDQRDPRTYKTVLSGNNVSNHVVLADGVGPGTVLDGLIIADGEHNSHEDPTDGMGIRIYNNSSLLLRNCSIQDNMGSRQGAGVFVENGSIPRFWNCDFRKNNSQGSGSGGGVYSDQSGLLFKNCLFHHNQADSTGGGANIDDATFVNCAFRGNSTNDNSGGGLYGANLTLINCLFTGNECGVGNGGGAQITGSGETWVVNCTFVDNRADNTPGNDSFGGGLRGNGSTVVVNSIFWNNTASESPPPEDIQISNVARVDYSCIEGGWTGAGANNISDDPMFVDQDGSDNNTPFGGALDNNLHLQDGSPCIDSGTDEAVPQDVYDVDLDGVTDEEILDIELADRFFRGSVDMGCYDTRDCDHNNISDLTDIENADGDPYTSDCNMNFVLDGCEIEAGTSLDCNLNGVPDECEIPVDSPVPGGPWFCLEDCNDCNQNGIPDDCDIASGTSEDCNLNGIPDECGVVGGFPDGGEIHCGPWPRPMECVIADCTPGHPDFPSCVDCDENGIPDRCDIEDGTGEDCNENGRLDSCDIEPLNDTLDQIVGAGSGSFRTDDTDVDLYQTMIGAYGIPWASGTNQTPMLSTMVHPASPAEELRALAAPGCGEFADLFSRVAREFNAMEMLLGNEAYSDALDPTVGGATGAKNITPDILGDLYSFEGVSGIDSLLEEELALLRGREISGDPANDDLHYPIYNRLPFNADSGSVSLAYINNYDVIDNEAASLKWPQGHGDAYGYYLRAIQVYLDGFRGTPLAPEDPVNEEFARTLIEMQPTDTETVDPGEQGGGDQVSIPYEGVRNMVESMAARARTVDRIVDLTFRRDYREDLENLSIEDTDSDRAWGTVDWARRGAMGAYLDWAVANQLLPSGTEEPTDDLGEVNRFSVDGIRELSAVVSRMQERVDAAAAGLNPLGLAANVVSFQLDPNRLDTWLRNSGATGASHYQQMAEIADSVLDNAQTIFEWANQAEQRLRQQSEDQATFAEQVAASEADFNNRLIEFFGYSSPDDPSDNDLDGLLSEDDSEADQEPDLTGFIFTSEQIQNFGWRPRKAPGEIQLAISDFFIASQKHTQAVQALENLQSEIVDLTEFITFRTQKAAEEISIINQAGDRLEGMVDRLEDIEFRTTAQGEAGKWLGMAGDIVGGMATNAFLTRGKPIRGKKKIGALGVLGAGLGILGGHFAAADEEERQRDRFEQQREEIRINTWKEAQLAGIENEVEIEKEKLQLETLIRESPQLMINVTTAREEANAAFGRLNAAVARGQRLAAERERLRKLRRDNLQRHRWSDVSFRVFRNNALQKYAGFFDLAQRYVMLAARAFAYEFPTDRDIAEQLLADLHRQRRLGTLRGIVFDLDNLFLTAPAFQLNSEVTFSVRSDLMGLSSVPTGQGLAFTVDVGSDVCTTIDLSQNPTNHSFATGDAVAVDVVGGVGNFLHPPLNSAVTYFVHRVDSRTFTLHTNPTSAAAGTNAVDITSEGNPFNGSFIWFAAPDLDFRAVLESSIVEQWQDLPQVQQFVDVEGQQGLMGPAIVLPFMSDTRSQRNFFGKFGELFGGDNLGFGEGRNMKILRYAVGFPGVDGGSLGNPTNVAVFLIPRGQSLFNGRSGSEDPRPWAVLDQNLPRPPLITTVTSDVESLDFNPWADASDANGHLFSFKPIRTSNGRIDGTKAWNSNLAGRSAWNNDWLMVVPGAQFSTGDGARENLLTFIYGPGGDPGTGLGIEDIELTIEAYSD